MQKTVVGLFCFLVMLILVPHAWSEVDIQKGNWEISIEEDKLDDGSGKIPRVFLCCLSETQLIPVDPSEPEECDYSDPQIEGDQVMYTRICHSSSGRVMETNAELVFNGNTMNGYLHTTIDDPKTGISDMTEYISGELKEPCPAQN